MDISFIVISMAGFIAMGIVLSCLDERAHKRNIERARERRTDNK